ncbi:MAG: hypothetical protein V3R73_03525 [Sphingomonadales bacterium]
MFGKPSLITRIAVGKLVGFLFGLAGLIMLPYFLPEAGWMLRIAVLLWYTTLGAIIGVFGVITWHPMLKMPMPWWFTGFFMGAWMNLLLVLFAYDLIAEMMITVFGPDGMITSPYWAMAEGAIIGLVIAYFATRFGGEGPETAGK